MDMDTDTKYGTSSGYCMVLDIVWEQIRIWDTDFDCPILFASHQS